MQRSALRAMVGGVVRDVPLGVFTSGQVMRWNAITNLFEGVAAGAGDFVGPGASTDLAIVKFSGTTGKLGQNSGVLIDASNNMTGLAQVTGTRFNGPATGLRETSGPTDLTNGAVADGARLTRSGSTLIGKMETLVELAADFAVSNTSLVNVTGMTFTLVANAQYLFSWDGVVNQATSASTNAFGVSFSGTTTRTQYGLLIGTGSGSAVGGAGTTTIGGALSVANQNAATTLPFRVAGSITVGASGGTLQLQAARSVATTTLRAGLIGLLIQL